MNEIISALRNANADIESLHAKREELKKKLEQHRSGNITKEEFDKLSAQRSELDKEIELRTKFRDELSKIVEGQQKRGGGMAEFMTDPKELRAIDLIRYDLTAAENRGIRKAFEERAANFKTTRALTFSATDTKAYLDAEKRAITSLTAGIVKPTVVGEVSNAFNQLITITDQVSTVNMEGAGSYKIPYVKTPSTASKKTEGVAATESNPEYGSVTISPENVAVLSYISREVEKVTPVDYMANVAKLSLEALKVKLAGNIIEKIKTGQDDASAVMSETYNVSATNGMLDTGKGKINEKTLRNIVMSYGGNTNVYGNAILYLNKNDLIAFGDVRGTNEKKAVYEITPNEANPNIGTIKDGGLTVPYCIVPTLTALSGTAQTTTPVQTMVYGSPMNFEEAIFGDFGVRVSSEYKFAEGLLAIMGEVMAGGAVKVKNGFLIVTIPKSGT